MIKETIRETVRKPRYEIPSVRRAGQVLRTIASWDGPLGISELSRVLGLPKASVFRIVRTLEVDGLLERVDGHRFEIGRSAFEIGSVYARRFDSELAFRAASRRLVSEYNETVQLAILVGTEVLYIGKEDSSQPVRLVSELGARLPAHVTALGKALLSCLSEVELRSLYTQDSLIQLTPNSHASFASLIEDLQKTRARGWAHDNEESAVGLQCVAAPIIDERGRAEAAISVSAPSQRLSEERLAQLGEAVQRAAFEISNPSATSPRPWSSDSAKRYSASTPASK